MGANTANYITIARMLLTPTMLLVEPLSPTFMAIYVLCGLGDIVDGAVARRTGTTSRLGSVLDSLADFVFCVVIMFILLRILWGSIPPWLGFYALSTVVIRFVTSGIILLRFGVVGGLHTYLNKVTGLVVFLTPLILTAPDQVLMVFIASTIALVSAAEGFAISVIAREYDPDLPSIVHLLSGRGCGTA
ncbi:MAG: CDP-alcohol phosphatidyltransferase family protein [Candidatus Methanomethylophilaceae archaeon]|nr:CDP-alcohol phosphatidyltransferase family protein [Candidatus Methanomethylophilaceae archaeon]